MLFGLHDLVLMTVVTRNNKFVDLAFESPSIRLKHSLPLKRGPMSLGVASLLFKYFTQTSRTFDFN